MRETAIFRGFFVIVASKPLFDAGLTGSNASKAPLRLALETNLGPSDAQIGDSTITPSEEYPLKGATVKSILHIEPEILLAL